MFWQRAPSALSHSFLAMGTEVRVTVIVRSSAMRARAESAIAELQSMILEFGRDAWAWGPGQLGQFNRVLAGGGTATIPLGLKVLFRRSWECRQVTDGLFEPRVGSLVRLWGFDEISRIRTKPPSAPQIAEQLKSMQAAPDLDDTGTYGPANGVTWDFGGIGKGYIVDRALGRLAERGFPDASVDAGGNLAVRGAHGRRPWRIGIRNPCSGVVTDLLGALTVRDEAVITHGDDQRYFEHAGTRYAHLLDPKTGWPVRGMRSLTVVHPDATTADGVGAALFVAGSERWVSTAARLGIDQVLVVDGEGRVSATPRLAARLETPASTTIASVGS